MATVNYNNVIPSSEIVLSADAYSMADVGDQNWEPGWIALVPALAAQEFMGYSRSKNPPGGVIALGQHHDQQRRTKRSDLGVDRRLGFQCNPLRTLLL